MDSKISFNTSSPYFIGIISLLAGLAMILWPGYVVSFSVLIIGWFLVIMGALPIIYSLIKKLPISMISVIFLIAGIIILIFNRSLVNMIMWIFGIILILASVQQLNMMSLAKKEGFIISKWSYLYPTILLLGGVVILLNPFSSLQTLVIFFGCFLLFFGITMLVSRISIKKVE
ncbi:MAG: DUF308 domain-containing protein [Bacteroidales bacterium]|nr:DUF308 domain-containing protein [Bacteroidales bacterium]